MSKKVQAFVVIEFKRMQMDCKILGTFRRRDVAERFFDRQELKYLSEPVKYIRLVTCDA